MTCTEFGTVVVDLARGRPVDAAVRARADAHAQRCDSCREHLSGERAVTEQLAALRASMREVAAPPELEGTLVAAFRARPSVAPTASARRSATSPRWWLGAVAGLALAVGGALAGRWLADGQSRTTAPGPAVVEIAPSTPARTAAVTPAPETSAEAPSPIVDEPVRAVSSPATLRRRPAAARAEPTGAARAVYASLPAAMPRWSDEPLVPVRLQLPYAALPALGLQITREQWGETVPVEVLVGEDGIARGIRLVQD